MIYISIEKSSGIIRGMAIDIGTLKSMIVDSKRRVRDYTIVGLSDLDCERWCVGRNKMDRDARFAAAKERP